VNHRRKKFIPEYLLCGNATEAALKAGYSEKTAYSQGQRLLKNVEIMNEINDSQEKIQEEAEVKLKEIVLQIKKLAFNGESESIRLKALDMLMKHLGGYMDSFKMLAIMKDEQLEQVARKIPSWFDNV
jgi:phage terminase small subunit